MKKIILLALFSAIAVSSFSQMIGSPPWPDIWKYKTNYGSSFCSSCLVDKNYVDSSILHNGGGGNYIQNQDTSKQNANSRYKKSVLDTLIANTEFVAHTPGVVDDSSFFSVDSSGDSRGMFFTFGAKSRYVEMGWVGGGNVDYWHNYLHFDTALSYYSGDQGDPASYFWETYYYPNGKPTYKFNPNQHGPGGAIPPYTAHAPNPGRLYAVSYDPPAGIFLWGTAEPIDGDGNQGSGESRFLVDTGGNAQFQTLQLDARNSTGQVMHFANNCLPVGASTDSLLTDSAGYVRHIPLSSITTAAMFKKTDRSGNWLVTSDINLKENFENINTDTLLEKLNTLPITQWNYKIDPEAKHIGPMAQDFYSRFHLGTDNTKLSPIDPAGVALAGIKGLYVKWMEAQQELKSQESIIDQQGKQMETMQIQMEAMMERVSKMEAEATASKDKN